ncbi:MAG: hypothetical protein LBG18_02650 [Mediterranea sp.]|nr:hypothetical protein [Mediterranea sp.]
MRNLCVLLSLIFACTCVLNAQEHESEKKAMILRMGEFKWLETAEPKDKDEYITHIQAIAADAATQSGRFEVVDEEIADSESKFFMREEFMDLEESKRKELLGKLMNDYTLFGEITKCKFTKRTSGAMGYTCVLTVKLSVTNALSGKDEFAASRTFVSDFKKLVVKNTMGAALDDALQSVSPKMISFFTNNFAVTGAVAKIQDGDVVITCGQPQGVKKGDEFQVTFVTIADDGARTETSVGIVKVKSLLADGTSICDIRNGKDAIGEKFIASSTSQWLNCKLILK